MKNPSDAFAICPVREGCVLTVHSLRREKLFTYSSQSSHSKKAMFSPTEADSHYLIEGLNSVHIQKNVVDLDIFCPSVLCGREIIARKHSAPSCSCWCVA